MSKPRVYINLEGGIIQDVWADSEVDVIVLDFDTEGGDEDRTTQMGNGDLAYVSEYRPCRVDVKECEAVDKAIAEDAS